ncbi:MAG: hypothetical protein QOE65_2552 [Solirubrobacteraceae bacterium]|jgi:hypothetical protein|nr:hypothetical protein [Solirubrobacteraceae bacterium]
MRNRTLHQSLRDFAEQAAFQLEADASGGAEIPFEVVESPGARAPLYCYRPLTGQFIRERLGVLGRLPTYGPAKHAIESLGGVDAYLRVRGEPRVPEQSGERADAALRSFLSTLYAEVTEFEFSAERFSRAYAELEAAVYETRALSAVIAPLHGLELVSEDVPIVEGLSLVRADTVEGAPAEAVWGRPVPGPGDAPNAVVMLSVEGAPGDGPPLAEARARFAALLTALRLVDAAGFALGSSAWARTDAGPWQLVSLATGGGVPAGPPYRVEPDEEDELRGFCNLVARRAEGARGEVAFALRRFEMACERTDPFDALTDHLLALRSLLEPEGPASGRLAQRLAAICAMPEQRAALAERAAHAISLERGIVAGLAPAAPDAEALVADTAHHLRALLRDVLCGHLSEDLVTVADDLLAEALDGPHEANPSQTGADSPPTNANPYPEPGESEPETADFEPQIVAEDARRAGETAESEPDVADSEPQTSFFDVEMPGAEWAFPGDDDTSERERVFF